MSDKNEIGWVVYDMPDEVVPINDLKPHKIGSECWCKPFLYTDVIIHNAMDEREYYEPDSIHEKRKPSSNMLSIIFTPETPSEKLEAAKLEVINMLEYDDWKWLKARIADEHWGWSQIFEAVAKAS